jgi:hypothetical protein
MKQVKTYSTTLEADVARIALEAAGVPATVVGTGADLEGGIAGVRLLVPDEYLQKALKVLKDS